MVSLPVSSTLSVRAAGVVVVGEGVELGLQLAEGGGPVLAGEPVFQGLVQPLDLAQVCGWGREWLRPMPKAVSSRSTSRQVEGPAAAHSMKTSSAHGLMRILDT
jgi:hypothetical protein